MEHNLHHTISVLDRFPSALNAFLADLPDAWTTQNEGENTWSVADVIAHLVYLERADWMRRVKIILEFGEAQAFPPLDPSGHLWERQEKPLSHLLEEFTRLRGENLSDLRAMQLQPEDLERSGQHPGLGSVTLSQLLATWATHDLTHLHQISRIMARQYQDAVGPWSRYLGVLHCDGHGSR
jgi:uncharacterized damage-inducible protein DinB